MGEMNQQDGLILKRTTSIQNFLKGVILDSKQNSRNSSLLEAEKYVSCEKVPYVVVRDLWLQIEPSRRPKFSTLVSDLDFALESPKPREKSKELQERLRKLQDIADKKAYKELVKDIVREEEDRTEPFSTYTTQLGFGLQVIVTMFAGYLIGHLAFRALFGDQPVMNAAGGICGLVCGMLLETIVFMVRSSISEISAAKPGSRKAGTSHQKKS